MKIDHTPLRSLHFILFNILLACLVFLFTLHIWDIPHSTVKLIQCFHLCGFCLAFYEVYFSLLELPLGSYFIIFLQGGFLFFLHCDPSLLMSLLTAWNIWFISGYGRVFLLPLSWFWYSEGRVDCSIYLIWCWASSHMVILLAYAFDTRFVSSLSYNVSTSFLHSPKMHH